MSYDVIVVGAGPSGSVLAFELASKGRKVLVIEAQRLPRRKTCAGGVSAAARKLVSIDLSPVLIEPLNEITFGLNFDFRVRFNMGFPYCYTARRDQLDFYLVNKAREAGADVIEGVRVSSVAVTGAGVKVVGKGLDGTLNQFESEILVGADGCNSIVGRQVKLGLGKTVAIAVETEIEAESPDGHGCALIDYGCIRGGYGWVFPKGSSVSTGIGTFLTLNEPLKIRFDAFLRRLFPRRALLGVTWKGSPIPLGGSSLNIASERVILVGDAAGLTDPLIGEGIRYAFHSGTIGARCINDVLKGRGKLSEYQRQIDEEITKELKVAKRISRSFYKCTGFVHRYFINRGRLIEKFLDVIAGESSYTRLASWLLKYGILEPFRRPMGWTS